MEGKTGVRAASLLSHVRKGSPQLCNHCTASISTWLICLPWRLCIYC